MEIEYYAAAGFGKKHPIGFQVTAKEFIDNVEKNGYARAIGQYVRWKKSGKVLAACAVGQARLNIGKALDINEKIAAEYRITVIDKGGFALCNVGRCAKRDSKRAYIVEMAIHLNDQHRYSLADNAAKLRELFLE